jgi:glycerophosphoryl diester phosphodiesterase
MDNNRSQPLNYAHRGASHEAPANTLAAFRRAIELGADGIELDVHLSSDGEVVVIHDFDLAATTDGTGAVREKSLSELKELDAGGWFAPAFAGERIPTLQEVIDEVGKNLLLNVEIKTKSLQGEGLAESVVETIVSNGLSERVIVSSFNPLAVQRVRRLEPSIPIGLLYAPDQALFLRRAWFRHLLQPQALHPDHRMVDAEYMQWARDRGYRIHVWTVDEPAEMRRLEELGVDLIVTNRPDLLRATLEMEQER